MDIYLDGLERSGNVFLGYLLSFNLDIGIITTRKHDLEILQGYKNDLPFIVPVRDALPSLVSARIYRKYVYENNLFGSSNFDDFEPFVLLPRYRKYIKYLIDHPEFFIAPFEEFTNNSDRFLKTFTKVYPEANIVDAYSVEQVIAKGKDEQSKSPYQKINALSNFPRDNDLEKKQVEKMFLDNHKEMIDAIQANIDILYKRYYDLI
jgi:hypothetical protein